MDKVAIRSEIKERKSRTSDEEWLNKGASLSKSDDKVGLHNAIYVVQLVATAFLIGPFV